MIHITNTHDIDYHAYIQNTFNPLIPLKSIAIDGELYDINGKIQVTQVFENNSLDSVINAVYCFALDTSSVVTDFCMFIGARKLVGKIEERKTAEATYNKAKDEGKKACLLEKVPSTHGNYKVRIGNIGRNERVTVSFAYLTQLEPLGQGKFKFALPTNIAPKYNRPSTNPKDQAYGEFVGSIPYSNVVDYTFNLKLRFASASGILSITSNTNNIEVESVSDKIANITCSTQPNEGTFTVLLETIPKSAIYRYSKGDDHFLATTCQIPSQQVELVPKNFQFVIDRSGSMDGSKMEQAKEALLCFIDSLSEGSLFNVISFGTDHNAMWSHSVEYTNENVRIAKERIPSFQADMGGTEILSCLQDSLTNQMTSLRTVTPSPNEPNMEKVYILLTDGDVGNVNELVDMLKQHSCRVFTVGIGRDAGRDLIEKVARSTNATSRVIIEETSLASGVIDILDVVYKQYYTNIEVKVGDKVIDSLSTLYPDQVFTLYANLDTSTYQQLLVGGLKICGNNPITHESFEWLYPVEDIVEGSSILHQLYGYRQIHNLFPILARHGWRHDESKYEQSLKDVVRYSIAYHIMTDYTSFVVVDESNSVTDIAKEPSVDVHVPHFTGNQNFLSFTPSTEQPLVHILPPAPANTHTGYNERARMSSALLSSPPKAPAGVMVGGGGAGGPVRGVVMKKCKAPLASRCLTASLSMSVSSSADTETTKQKEEIVVPLTIKNITDCKQVDGSFQYADAHLALINYTKSLSEFKQEATSLNITDEIYFNILVLMKLKKEDDGRYKIMIMKLEKWINNKLSLHNVSQGLDKLLDNILKL